MDFATLIGALATAGLILGAIMAGSGLGAFIDVPSLMIVVCGTFTVTLINYPLKNVLGAIKIGLQTMFDKKVSVSKESAKLIELSKLARKEGVLALESEVDAVEDPLMRKGLQLLVDGVEPELIETVLYDELDTMGERHGAGAKLFKDMAATAPALGLVGTLIGLVQMLQNMSDPSAIGPAMAIAMLTTFYGALLANCIFTPISGKLQVRHSQEVAAKRSIIKGLLGIAKGVNPRILGQHLESELPPGPQREELRAAA